MPRVTYTYRMNYGLPGKKANPLVRALGVVLSVMLLAVAAVFGFVFLMAALGVVVIGGSILAIRVWLLKRRIEKDLAAGQRSADESRKDYIDADYIERNNH
jgi:uncharacterized membrane-anchored protein